METRIIGNAGGRFRLTILSLFIRAEEYFRSTRNISQSNAGGRVASVFRIRLSPCASSGTLCTLPPDGQANWLYSRMPDKYLYLLIDLSNVCAFHLAAGHVIVEAAIYRATKSKNKLIFRSGVHAAAHPEKFHPDDGW